MPVFVLGGKNLGWAKMSNAMRGAMTLNTTAIYLNDECCDLFNAMLSVVAPFEITHGEPLLRRI
jgi:hypothetical protein